VTRKTATRLSPIEEPSKSTKRRFVSSSTTKAARMRATSRFPPSSSTPTPSTSWPATRGLICVAMSAERLTNCAFRSWWVATTHASAPASRYRWRRAAASRRHLGGGPRLHSARPRRPRFTTEDSYARPYVPLRAREGRPCPRRTDGGDGRPLRWRDFNGGRSLRDYACGRHDGASAAPEAVRFPHNLKIISVNELISYRLRKDRLIERIRRRCSRRPTSLSRRRLQEHHRSDEHLALSWRHHDAGTVWCGSTASALRATSLAVSLRLRRAIGQALQRIGEEGRASSLHAPGGRGIGLHNKLRPMPPGRGMERSKPTSPRLPPTVATTARHADIGRLEFASETPHQQSRKRAGLEDTA